MTVRAYVAAPLPMLAKARSVAAAIREWGHVVVSSWHTQSPTVEAEARLTEQDRDEIGALCRAEIRSADVLVLVYGPATVRHGSMIEAGYAMGLGKRVLAYAPEAPAAWPSLVLDAEPVSWPALRSRLALARGAL